jgi:hypothetical protein
MELIAHRITGAIVCAIIAFPLGGFVFGFLNCEDCGWNILERVFIGMVLAVLTPITGGFPAFAGSPPNVWPYISSVALVLYFLLVLRWRPKATRREKVP